jgi:hypothetical protein
MGVPVAVLEATTTSWELARYAALFEIMREEEFMRRAAGA